LIDVAQVGHFACRPHLPHVTNLSLAEPGIDQNVRLAAEGDEAAFASLVSVHHASMVRVAYAITGDAAAAADAAQAAWAVAWRRLGSLREASSVRPWLVAIAANEARQAIRRGRGVHVVDISDHLDAESGGDPADGISSVDLGRALRRLGAEERMLLALRFVAGMDSTEIATHLGLSPSGVRSRLSRLIERLRTELDHA
jgi:RNA polymerase sigma-70 factor (ECF subfamily)